MTAEEMVDMGRRVKKMGKNEKQNTKLIQNVRKTEEKPERTRIVKAAADRIVMLPVSEVRPYERNPRKNADAVKYVKASIEKFGFKVPIIIDSNRIIICGHTRLLAAKSLGMTEVPCIMADDLTDDQIKAFRLADNKVGEFAEWDMDMLGDELDAIADASDIDMEALGFDLSETEDETEVVEDEVQEDEVTEEVEPVCKKGDLWQLGSHRLVCGSCTDPDAMSKLMGGQRADIAFTSPPYNMMATGFDRVLKSGKVNVTYDLREGTYNDFSDDLSNEDYGKLLNDALKMALTHADDALYNIGILASSKIGIVDMISKFKNKFCDILVWNKNNCIPLGLPSNAGMVSHICELIFCFNQTGTRSFSHPQWKKGVWNGQQMINRIDSKNQMNNEYSKIHHATFPVEFAGQVIKMYSEKSVLDQFGGTGTTLIAAEQLNRKCYMMELDPHYCDVIIARWEKFTGGKAELISKTTPRDNNGHHQTTK